MYIGTLLLIIRIPIVPVCIEYCVKLPLGVTGGLHCKVTELEVMETISNEHGSLGTYIATNNWW